MEYFSQLLTNLKLLGTNSSYFIQGRIYKVDLFIVDWLFEALLSIRKIWDKKVNHLLKGDLLSNEEVT